MYIKKQNKSMSLKLSPLKRNKGIKIKGYMIKLLVCLSVILVTAMLPAQPVYAAGAIGSVDSFDNLAGDARYLGSAYRENYYLDMEETGLLDALDAMFNGLANIIFSFTRWLAYLTVTVFYKCFNLNIADLFGTQANDIQNALNGSIFQPLFLLGCGVSFCILAIRFVKQDLAGAVGQLAKIIGIVMLSVVAVTHSGTVLSYCTNITKEISVSILSGVNSVNGFSANINDFAAQGAGVLWQNLIHEPWITMEFGKDSPSAEDIELFLSASPGSDAREALVEARAWDCFSMKRSGEKIGFMLMYLIPFVLKCVVYILVAVVQLVFQLLAVFYVFMAPLILVISLMPGYERMLGLWLRKILESQVSILIITTMIGVLIKLDQLLFDWARNTQSGWFIALVIQVCLALALFFNRNKLLNLMSNIHRGVATPGFAANRFKMGGNLYQNTVPNTVKFGKTLGKVMTDGTEMAAGFTFNTIRVVGERVDKVRNRMEDDGAGGGSGSVRKEQAVKKKQTGSKTDSADRSEYSSYNNRTGAGQYSYTGRGQEGQKTELPAVVYGGLTTLPGSYRESEPDIRIKEISSTDSSTKEKTGTGKEEEKPASSVQAGQAVNQNQESTSGLQRGMEHLADIMESTVSRSDSGGKETERPVLMPGAARPEKEQDTKSVNVTVHLEAGGREQTVSGTTGDNSGNNEVHLKMPQEKNILDSKTQTGNMREQMAAVREKDVKNSHAEAPVLSPAQENNVKQRSAGISMAANNEGLADRIQNKTERRERKALDNYSIPPQSSGQKEITALSANNIITGQEQYSKEHTDSPVREPSGQDRNAVRHDSRPDQDLNISPDKVATVNKTKSNKVIQPDTVRSENRDSTYTGIKSNKVNKLGDESATGRNSPVKIKKENISADMKLPGKTQISPKLDLNKDKSE